MIAVGGTIGSGIFLTPALVAQQLPSPVWILLVWAIGGVITLCGALTFAELGGMMPNAGGMYVYLTEAYSPLVGFLFGWAYFLVVNTGGLAGVCIAFATYIGHFVSLPATGIQLVAIGGLVFVTILNVVGVKIGGIFADLFTILKIGGIGILVVVGIGWGAGITVDASAPAEGLSTSTLAAAMVGVLWSYGGWQHASFAAGEAKTPTRSVPIAMVLGAAIVTTSYVLANVAYLFILSPEQLGASQRPASDAISMILGPAGGSITALAIFISTFGSAGIYTLTAPRIYFAMANDGLFFKKVSEVHPKFHTPAFAIILQTCWATALILFWGTFNEVISYVVFTDWIFFGLTGAAVLVLRKQRPNAERPYKTLGYPFTPLFFVLISTWFVINTLIEQPAQAWAGIAFLAVGVPVYYYWKRKYQVSKSKNG
jgi:APA family basic amino acid/polyamine antiporter